MLELELWVSGGVARWVAGVPDACPRIMPFADWGLEGKLVFYGSGNELMASGV